MDFEKFGFQSLLRRLGFFHKPQPPKQALRPNFPSPVTSEHEHWALFTLKKSSSFLKFLKVGKISFLATLVGESTICKTIEDKSFI